MPKVKPSVLNNRNDTKEDRAARAAAESAMTPKTKLTDAIPHILRGKEHAKAKRIWKRIVGLYQEVDGTIATAFDQDMIIKYCLLEEEVDELALMRKKMKADWERTVAAARRLKMTEDNLTQWTKMWDIVNAMYQKFQGMDARLDGKRKLSLTMSQSLYLTPRSRAGVAPPTKEPDQPKSEMEKLLDG